MKDKWLAWGLLLLLAMIWGSSFILMKKGLLAFSPYQLACLRISIAGLVLSPLALRHIRVLSWQKAAAIFAFGLSNAGLPAFLFAIAETRVNSSTAGILNALTPIFTFTAGVIFFGVAFHRLRMLGVIIGFLGACMLIFFGNGFSTAISLSDENMRYTALLVPATICYGFSGNIIAKYLRDVPGLVISCFSYLFFTPILLTWLFLTDFRQVVQTPQGLVSLGYIAILAVFGSAIAILLFSILVQKSNALFSSFVTYLLPFVSILWGLADNEKIGYVPILSLFVILAGILITGIRKKPRPVAEMPRQAA